MVAVIHDADGETIGVAEAFSGMREPLTPLPTEITAITGITADMLAGEMIDLTAVEDFVRGAHRVCCHNAAFDRGFAERLVAGFAHLPWVCSLREIDWAVLGTVATKLQHILGHFGRFHDAHRAV